MKTVTAGSVSVFLLLALTCQCSADKSFGVAKKQEPQSGLPVSRPLIREVDPLETATPLSPQEILPFEGPVMPRDIRVRYGLERPGTFGLSIEERENRRPPYATEYKMTLGEEVPASINGYYPFGAKAVECFRRVLHKTRYGAAAMLSPEEKKSEHITLWRWEVPEPLQKSWLFSSSNVDSSDIDTQPKAVLLTPARWNERNPTLLMFDAKTGLRWQREVPLSQIIEGCSPSRANYSSAKNVWEQVSDDGNWSPKVLASAQGDRVVVIISYYSLNRTFVFLYNRAGVLETTIAFTESMCSKARLTPNAQRIFLNMRHSPEQPDQRPATGVPPAPNQPPRSPDIHGYYCMDFSGNLLGRFVDEKGKDCPSGMVGWEGRYSVRDVTAKNRSKRLYVHVMP